MSFPVLSPAPNYSTVSSMPKTKIENWNVEAMYDEYLKDSARVDAEMEAKENAAA